ncbi:MAG: gliding motility protein GldM [Bacteroidota bacterium]|nr:gliding motility protein GldM [Bacteroidota bacterium]
MSNAKETPRQKMIGMMYLVLTCLLALNVSKEVLQGFVTINESIETTNLNFSSNTKKMMDAFQLAIKNGKNEAKPYYLKAKEVTELSQKTFDYITILKQNVQQYTENVKGSDTMKLARIERLDDYDRPTYLLIGTDETKPTEAKHSAKELRHTIEGLTTSLNKMIDEIKDKEGLMLPAEDYLVLKDKIKLFTPHDNYKDKEGKAISWELKNFYNMPLAGVITNLSKMQTDIRNIESEMVNSFAAAAGKLAIKFDVLQARIVPVSNYIQSGSAYTADVFLTASSTTFNDENMQFILGDVDTATGKMSDAAIVLPIDNGTGKINIPTSIAGHKDIKGWIKFKGGDGLYKYFKYENDFVVANAAVAVSPDKMNVLYAGVENPLTVSAAGVAPTDLVVTISGCNATIANNGNGKYTTKVSGTGTCVVTVMQRTAGGLKRQGSPQYFRVKRFPNPPLKVSGKSTYGNLDMKLAEAKNINAIGVDNAGFDFIAPFKMNEFVMNIVNSSGVSQDYKCIGSQLSPTAKEALLKLKVGNKIYFENIRVQAPDGERDFPLIKIVVK